MALFRSEASPQRGGRSGRTNKLLVVVAATIVVVAVGALTMAAWRGAPRPGGQVIAVVGRHEVTEQDLQAEARAQALPFRPALRPALLETVVSRLLLADAAKARGLDRRPEFPSEKRRMEAQTLAEQFMRQVVQTETADRSSKGDPARVTATGDRRRFRFRVLHFAAGPDLTLPTNSLDDLALALRRNGVSPREERWEAYTEELPPGLLQAVDAAPGSIVLWRDGVSSAAYQVEAMVNAPSAGEGTERGTSAALARAARRSALTRVIERLRSAEPVRYRQDYQPKTSR